MQRFFVLIFMFILFICLPALAVQVTLDEVRDVGATQLAADAQINPAAAAISYYCQPVKGVREVKDNDTGVILAYILDLVPRGFIAVSPDSDIRPVIAYSYKNDFIMDDIPGNTLLQMIKTDMNACLQALPAAEEQRIAANNAAWADYLSADSGFVQQLALAGQWPSGQDGWVTTQWNQYGYTADGSAEYNQSCPVDLTTGNRSVVGCVATAMAQIINYWQYPASVSFTSADNYITLNTLMLVEATPATMSLIDYNSGNISGTTIAQLSFACGVSVQMGYSSTGSGAYTSDVVSALLNKFRYVTAEWGSTDSIHSGDYYSDNFYRILKDNIQNAKPVSVQIDAIYYSGYTHEVVFDGYRDNPLSSDPQYSTYHINYGWGGTSDAWYTLPNMDPPYDWVQEAVFDIYPNKAGSSMVAGHDCGGVTSAASTWYLAEGCTAGEFDTWVLLQNPNSTSVTARVTLFTESSSQQLSDIAIGGNERYSIHLNNVLPNENISTKVQFLNSGTGIVERAMYLGSNWRAGHDSVGATAGATTWYLAEGCTRTGFETYILVMNPSASTASVTVTGTDQDGNTASGTLTLAPNRRGTVRLNNILPGVDVSTIVTSDQAVIAERAMYWNNWAGCHASLGVTATATSWYLAEGCTSGGFDTWILLQNPNTTTATVTATIMQDDGTTVQIVTTVDPNSRGTIHVDDTVPSSSFSSTITSNIGIVVERSMYFDSGNAGHNTPGKTAAATTWYLAEGCTTGGFDEWILIQNPNSTAATVTLTLMRDDGGTVIREYTVAATSRSSILVNRLASGSVSASLTSDIGIVVERAMYW